MISGVRARCLGGVTFGTDLVGVGGAVGTCVLGEEFSAVSGKRYGSLCANSG